MRIWEILDLNNVDERLITLNFHPIPTSTLPQYRVMGILGYLYAPSFAAAAALQRGWKVVILPPCDHRRSAERNVTLQNELTQVSQDVGNRLSSIIVDSVVFDLVGNFNYLGEP